MTTLRGILVTWLIHLIVRWSSHSVAPGFFGSAMKTDLEMSAGISPASYISCRRDVSFSIPYSSKASIISTAPASGPVALKVVVQ
ncbi:hypothetical protein ElyMa_002173500 [Elysia marginata]|uniref:Secreted protein n=1 Tax=Elysia marginata TaxID=1093978 RepID=A0AAV4FN71_9GAST|nr:hypothetical protein ElyMa_002173500 [Elysia marginata]